MYTNMNEIQKITENASESYVYTPVSSYKLYLMIHLYLYYLFTIYLKIMSIVQTGYIELTGRIISES